MTVVCALHMDGYTVIGADSRVTIGQNTRLPSAAKKWHISPDKTQAIASTGSGRTLVLIRESNILDKASGSHEVAEFLRELIKKDGYASSADDGRGALSFGDTYLYADASGVWDIDSRFATWPIDDGVLWARGSGMDYAVGAGFAMQKDASLNPYYRVRMAIEAAIANDLGCGGDIFIEHIGAK